MENSAGGMAFAIFRHFLESDSFRFPPEIR